MKADDTAADVGPTRRAGDAPVSRRRALTRAPIFFVAMAAFAAGCDGSTEPARVPIVVDATTGAGGGGGASADASTGLDLGAQIADAAPANGDAAVGADGMVRDAGPQPAVDAATGDAAVGDATVGDATMGDAGPVEPPELELIWSDEFDGPVGAAPDPRWWTYDVGGDGWGNAQLEFNTDRRENSALDGQGNLAIIAREEAFGGRRYTSARMKTLGRFSQQYGRFEARIQLPRGQGIWPAFWMLGADFADVGWPTCGEIDVMEFRGQIETQSTGALHGPGYSGGASIHAAYDTGEALPDGFHVFAVEWTAAGIRWFVDDQEFLRAGPDTLPNGAPWVFDAPFFMILNIAVGGSFLGAPDDTTVFPQRMLIDYIRVYALDDVPLPPPPVFGADDRLSVGIFYEGPARQGVPIDDARTHFYIYENTFALRAELGDRREGDLSDRLVHSGGPWWGGGVHWDDARDLSGWGRLHISLKSADAGYAGLQLGMNSPGDRQGLVSLAAYGFRPDGQWHDLEIPLADFVAAGADLTAIIAPVVFVGGAGQAGESVLVDGVYIRGPGD